MVLLCSTLPKCHCAAMRTCQLLIITETMYSHILERMLASYGRDMRQ